MDIQKDKNINISEKDIERAIIDTTTSPFTTISIEELADSTIITTPTADVFTPMVTRLSPLVENVDSVKYEWNESATDNVFSGSLYDGYTADVNQTSNPVRKDNYVMPLRRIAKTSKFTNAFRTTDVNAMANELRDRAIELKRSMEYYVWNGDRAITVPVQQTDGIKKVVTQSVSNATSGGVPQPLMEATLQQAIVQIYAEGNVPKIIACTPIVAQRIADFSKNNNHVAPQGFNGNTSNSFVYNSPFGFPLEVVPVLDEFIGNGTMTGDVFVLDTDNIRLVKPVNTPALMNTEAMAITQHGQSVILYSFMGVRVSKATKAHRKITNVLNQL